MAEPDGIANLPEASVGFHDVGSFEIAAAQHGFRFHPSGPERLASLLNLIDHAEHSLKACFYMFQPDHSGTRVRGALIRAAQRGVDVHLIIDAFGSDATDSFFDPVRRAGGKVSRFSPRWNVRYLIRNHQKFVIVDDSEVMMGGFNIADSYFALPKDDGWCDLGVTLQGAVVDRFADWFGELNSWLEGGASQFFAIRRLIRDWSDGDGPIQLLLGGPSKITSAWARAVKRDLARGSRLDMAMAYFSPPRSIRRLIRQTALRGGARVITAGKSDNSTTIGASRALYGGLLRSGTRIHEFQPCKLHLKLLVIDDVTYFGSANFDIRSIRLNLELMVRVEDAELAAKSREVIDNLAASSREITPDWYAQKATVLARIRWRLAWFMVSVLDYTVTRRLNI